MLEDYQIDDRLRYENHYLKVAEKDVQIGGALGAALLCALLVDTEEGNRRGIAIDSDVERQAWIAKYEREVRRNEWGLLSTEVELLSDAYIALVTEQMSLAEVCPNRLLMNLALQLMTTYMHYLTVEYFGAHIWESVPWRVPFAQWLLDAAQIETRRQRFLQMDWTDAALVTDLAEKQDTQEEPTLVFEEESAKDIQKRYFNWMWQTYQAMVREQPGAQPRAAKHRNFVVEQETDWSYLSDEINALGEEQRNLFVQWMTDWSTYVRRQLKPEKQVLFWSAEVSEEQQRRLTQFLRIQEKEWDYFKCLSASIYALRQMGYVRRACSVRDITRWMSEQLVNDYTTKNNHDQFVRAWKELGRYTDEVKHFVNVLEKVCPKL
ncbi:MAG: hypothetical protein J5621_05830 [Paludibacteraceae bacterium]|nr:hypothetical protein [Paludibacteraceae bacterium]